MRQMVLVCDDSCNSFSPSPPPLFFPLGFPLVSLLFFALKQASCATWVERAKDRARGHRDTDSRLHIWRAFILVQQTSRWLAIFCHGTACPFYSKVHVKSIKLGPPVSLKCAFSHAFPHLFIYNSIFYILNSYAAILPYQNEYDVEMNHSPPHPELLFHNMNDFLHCRCKVNSLAAYEHNLKEKGSKTYNLELTS